MELKGECKATVAEYEGYLIILDGIESTAADGHYALV